jgi:hypothetical protein
MALATGDACRDAPRLASSMIESIVGVGDAAACEAGEGKCAPRLGEVCKGAGAEGAETTEEGGEVGDGATERRKEEPCESSTGIGAEGLCEGRAFGDSPTKLPKEASTSEPVTGYVAGEYSEPILKPAVPIQLSGAATLLLPAGYGEPMDDDAALGWE